MVNERNLDNLLKSVMPEVNKQLVDDLENAIDYDYKFSWKFKQKMKKLSHYEERKDIPKKERMRTTIIRIVAEAAACIFALFILGSAFGVDIFAFSKFFTAKVFETKEGGLVHEYHSITEAPDLEDIVYEEPSYIPEGYKETDREELYYGIKIIYKNNHGGEITWEQNVAMDGMTFVVDNEYNSYEKIPYEEADMELFIYEEKQCISLYCEKGQYIYAISATDCEVNELIDILKSRKIIEK